MAASTSAKPTPLRNSYWVLPGKVLAGEHPSGTNAEATRERLKRLIDAGVECFIDLTEPGELRAYDPDLPFSIEYLRKPIKDHGTPAQRAHMAEILDCIHDAMQSGRCVYVHCRAGIGRTGTVVGCFLVERGLAGEAALDELNQLWQQCERSHSWASVPETTDQTDYVLKWKARAIFDRHGGLATTDVQATLPADDDSGPIAPAGATPYAHLLGEGASSPGGSPGTGGGVRSNSAGSESSAVRPRGKGAGGATAGAAQTGAADVGASGRAGARSSVDGSPGAGSPPHTGAGAPRAVVADAARAAASQSDPGDLLTDPTSVAKLPQPDHPRSGAPGWINARTPSASGVGAASTSALPAGAPGSGRSGSGSRPGASSPGASSPGASSPGASRSGAPSPGASSLGTPSPGGPSRLSAPSPSSPTGAASPTGQPRETARANAAMSRASSAAPSRTTLGIGRPSVPGDAPPGQSGVFRTLAEDPDPLLDPEALAAASNLRGRFLGALIGLAIGDAVAAATQYRRPGSFSPVGDMLGGGPFDLPRGGWSDDTAMALCLADSLLERDGFDARDQVERYRRWQQEGYLSATGQCVGITASSARAITMAQWRRQAFFGSHDPSQQDPEPLSRVAPAVLFYFATSGEAINQATEAARTTCQAPAVLDACRALARAVYEALTGQPKAIVLEKAALTVAPNGAGVTAASVDAARAGVAGSGAAPASRVGSSASAALAAAVAAFGATDNFREAVLYAANLGGDSDVVAAACGQLAGAYYGVKAIPTSWYNGLMQKELIVSYADRLLAHAMVGLGG